ncbi:MAG TPA: hypothetical protein VG676_16550 [Chitinophagaceae bacterium]|jgi:hypothetical protein|nr:hypothetical protein [Chitinophagaceae bacterium]
MKRVFFISVVVLVMGTKNSDAQTGVPDTLTYLQTIVANKANYIGQPFSTLLDTLQIQVKFFSPFAAIHYDKNKETSTSFAFYFPQTEDEMYLTYPCLEIYWQTYLNMNQSLSLYNFNNGGGWTTAVYNFYKNAIIKDIKVRE